MKNWNQHGRNTPGPQGLDHSFIDKKTVGNT